jgi:hypothetical protein
MPIACAVEPEVAELGRSPTDTNTKVNAQPLNARLRYTHEDSFRLPNGVTLYTSLTPLQI